MLRSLPGTYWSRHAAGGVTKEKEGKGRLGHQKEREQRSSSSQQGRQLKVSKKCSMMS